MAVIQNGGKRRLILKISIHFKTSALIAILDNGGHGLEKFEIGALSNIQK